MLYLAQGGAVIDEGNPVTRGYVKSRLGTSMVMGSSLGAEVGGMYLLHRYGHHRMERMLPMIVVGIEGFITMRNYRLVARYR